MSLLDDLYEEIKDSKELKETERKMLLENEVVKRLYKIIKAQKELINTLTKTEMI